MKFRAILALILALSLLTGCSWMDTGYVSVTPHQEHAEHIRDGMVSASNYGELRTALEAMVNAGQESCVINISDYKSSAVESGMSMAARYIQTSYPIGAYAVTELHYEVGSNSGKPAVAVNISYSHSSIEIQKIEKVQTVEDAALAMFDSMDSHDASLVLQVENFRETDFDQMARDYAEENPDEIMEVPQVSVGVYGIGASRLVEFSFAYENSRETLRQMKQQVAPVFAASGLYVTGGGEDYQKYSQLYAFLMERFDYSFDTSITPAYSLLCHGVGDSRAFATVYSAMCRQAGLEGYNVTGTCNGEPRTWNIICDNGIYYHVDLLRCNAEGRFRGCADWEMGGYVWDYSAFPACGGVQEEATEPAEETAAEE